MILLPSRERYDQLSIENFALLSISRNLAIKCIISSPYTDWNQRGHLFAVPFMLLKERNFVLRRHVRKHHAFWNTRWQRKLSLIQTVIPPKRTSSLLSIVCKLSTKSIRFSKSSALCHPCRDNGWSSSESSLLNSSLHPTSCLTNIFLEAPVVVS